MHISLGLRTEVIDNRLIKIDCPACKKSNVAAQAKDIRQTFLLFHFIPFFVLKSTTVRCESCFAELGASMKAEHLAQVQDSGFVVRYLWLHKPLILRVLVFCGIVAWILPVIGSVWTGGSYLWSRHYTGWIRRMALILFILSLVSTIGLIVGLIFSDTEKKPNQISEVSKQGKN